MSEIELPPEAVRRILWHAGDCGSREGEWWTFSHDGLLEFATAVAAEQVRGAILAERERCARECEELDSRCPQCAAHNDHEWCEVPTGADYAAAIRRGSV